MDASRRLYYAKKRLDYLVKHELEGVTRVDISQGGIYFEFRNGMNFRLSEDEITYQALEFLNSEAEYIKFENY